MNFEYDKKKNITNKNKHGISFEEAQYLWNDPGRLVIPAVTIDEPRYLLIGKIDHNYWSAVYTIRGQNIRLILVRRSGRNEKVLYKSGSV